MIRLSLMIKDFSWSHWFFLGCILGIMSCSSRLQPMGSVVQEAAVMPDAFVMRDGYQLPYRVWEPMDEPSVILVALHGFNDYSYFFDFAGRFLSERGILCYAYDQRGFGSSLNQGIWPGTETLVSDLVSVVELLKRRHQNVPLYLLGASMGGAVILSSMRLPFPPQVDGLILAAPAVWGREVMPPLYQTTLWLLSSLIPGASVGAPRGLNIMPSDNIEMLRALSQDPLIIKETRFDTLYGLVDLMDHALEGVAFLSSPTLVMYGANEQVLSTQSVDRLLSLLIQEESRVALYPQGFHMLLRDLNAAIPLEDIVFWIQDNQGILPSGAELTRRDSVVW